LPYVRYGTRLCAHAPNPTMQRPSVANIATFTTASIMLPSIESRLSFEDLSEAKIFPVASNASDDHHSLALLIGGPLVAARIANRRHTHPPSHNTLLLPVGMGWAHFPWGPLRATLRAERRLGFGCGRNSHYAIVPFGKRARARDRSRAIKARDLSQPCHQGREVMATKKKKAKKKSKY
jgi:hypothetical protein